MKVSRKIEAMKRGGAALGKIRDEIAASILIGDSFAEIEKRAQEAIGSAGFTPSFSTVPGYNWATCVMKNDEMCHGIPSSEKKVEDGDIITLDIGLISDGYHLDTTTTVAVGSVSSSVRTFLEVGKQSLTKAIQRVKPGNSVYDISFAMEKVLNRNGYGAVEQLTGHGVGEELHMSPAIPVVARKSDKRVMLKEGMTLAVEVMYTGGNSRLKIDQDGWTYRTIDGSLAGMFEETVLVTQQGYEILTKSP